MARQDGLAAILLAGGYSSRMQRFKPLLPLGGATVIEHAIGTFRGAGVRDLTVVVGHRGEELKMLLDRLHVRCVPNPDFDSGMYSSIAAGVRSLAAGVRACFVLPADMPAIRSHTVALIARTYRRKGASVVYPVFQGERGHPPLVSSRLFSAIASADGAGGLRGVLAGYDGEAREVGVVDEGVLMDLDTPADYSRACQVCGDRTIPTPAECEALLVEMKVSDGVARHCRAVGEVGRRLAERLNEAGLRLDVALVRAAGAVHDMAKGTPDHARAGYRVLRRLGFPRVAAVVASHTDIELGDDVALNESAIVYLADKLVRGDRMISLGERFEAALERFGDDAIARLAIMKRRRDALAIADEVERVLGAGLLSIP